MYLDEKSFTSPPVETKPAVFSIDGFLAWLEKQPLDTRYEWPDVCGCVCHQYLIGVGVDSRSRYSSGDTLGSVFPSLEIYQHVCATEPWTFGAALARARALLP